MTVEIILSLIKQKSVEFLLRLDPGNGRMFYSTLELIVCHYSAAHVDRNDDSHKGHNIFIVYKQLFNHTCAGRRTVSSGLCVLVHSRHCLPNDLSGPGLAIQCKIGMGNAVTPRSK